MTENVLKDDPQLIVGLDNDDNYIHIFDAKKNETYRCPCCKGFITPVAYDNDVKYRKQAHFAHKKGTEGCSSESLVHYIGKNWLFEKGCVFKVENHEYVVENFEIEKTLHTNFGDYRPDIIVTTSIGKIFYFEIKYSNKKTTDYIYKWEELGNDVVEVDAKEFINQNFNKDILEFSLIYSDGECFIKTYTRNNYDMVIGKIKQYWKNRQNRLDYKILWEKLDWFWSCLQDYKIDKSNKDKLLLTFRELSIYDMGVCWDLVFNKSSCFKEIKKEIREIINDACNDHLNKFIIKISDEFKEIATFSYECNARDCAKISWKFLKEYSVLGKIASGNISFYDSHWTIQPSKILSLVDEFNLEKENFYLHITNVKKLQKYVIDKNYGLLSDFFSFVYWDFNFLWETIVDINQAKSELDIIFNNKIFEYYIDRIAIQKRDVVNILKKYFDQGILKNILNIRYSDCYDSIWNIKCCDTEICRIDLCDEELRFSHEDFIIDYRIYNKDELSNIITNSLNRIINPENLSVTTAMYKICLKEDLHLYSNAYWNLSYDIETEKINITFKYLVPYVENYKRRCVIQDCVEIKDIFVDCTYEKYKEIVKNMLDNCVAPIMYKLAKQSVNEYNATHLNSIAYLTSEVKHDK